MELNIEKWFFIIALVSLGCNIKSNDEKCNEQVFEFLEKVKNYDVSIFLGLTLETRGTDSDGKRFIRDFEYKTRNKESILLPSLQTRDTGKTKSLESYDYIAYAKELGIDSSSAKQVIESRIKEISKVFLDLNVFRISSQLQLGEFIEFEIFPTCSVWFKLENANLNSTYSTLFNEADKLQENWFIINRRRIAPVLDNYPENFEVEN